MAPLDDAFRKFAWANEHLRVLEREMQSELDAKTYKIVQKVQTQITDDSSVSTNEPAELAEPPDLPPVWSLLIGDFAYNARAALDHLAWELAKGYNWRRSSYWRRRKPTEWPPDNLTFPVVARLSDKDDRKRLERKLRCFRPTDRATVAAEQPHRRRKQARSQPLWMLDRLRNADAHRELHTMLASVPADFVSDYQVVGSPGGGLAVFLPDEFEVFRMPGEHAFPLGPGDTVQTTLQIEGDFSPFVTFDQRGADFHGQEVLPLLRRCRDEVERILRLFPA